MKETLSIESGKLNCIDLVRVLGGKWFPSLLSSKTSL